MYVRVVNFGSVDYEIDDIRLQNFNAKSSCYVYDIRTFKPTAILNDQHFATYFVYNGEGKLIRKMIETERGIKIVKETQYYSPSVIHPN